MRSKDFRSLRLRLLRQRDCILSILLGNQVGRHLGRRLLDSRPLRLNVYSGVIRDSGLIPARVMRTGGLFTSLRGLP